MSIVYITYKDSTSQQGTPFCVCLPYNSQYVELEIKKDGTLLS